MTVLTKKQLLMLHSQLIAETGGVDGLRDEGMLESAMNAPFQSFAGEESVVPLGMDPQPLGRDREEERVVNLFSPMEKMDPEAENVARTASDLTVMMAEEQLGWLKLFAYTDVTEISYKGQQLLSLVENSEDFAVMLLWEPKSKQVWFLDLEHDVFNPVAIWEKFIQNPGYYINRAVMWEFD